MGHTEMVLRKDIGAGKIPEKNRQPFSIEKENAMYRTENLPYAYNALEPWIDAKTMEIHHGKHHATYNTNFVNTIEKVTEFKGMDLPTVFRNLPEAPEQYRTALRNNGGGVWNHNLYFFVIGPNKGGKPSGELLKAIEKDFGAFETFAEKFENAAVTRFGSGWAWLTYSGGKLNVTSTPNQDNPLMDNSGAPLLTIDVWEHAYYLNYQNRRADYVKAFWNVVNWDEVARLYAEAKK
jgi:superoxide dismutase, Fe-Mn family